MSSTDIIEALRKELPKILREQPELRYELIGVLAESLVTRAEFSAILERLTRIEEAVKGLWEEHNKLREDFNRESVRLWNEVRMLREDFDKGFKALNRRLDALGSRWGLMAEEAFREGVRGVVEGIGGGRVERWVYEDVEGYVRGYQSVVEVDVVVRDREHMLIDVKSHYRRDNLSTFLKVAKLYEKIVGVKPSRLMVVSPYVDDDAERDAMKLGVEVYAP